MIVTFFLLNLTTNQQLIIWWLWHYDGRVNPIAWLILLYQWRTASVQFARMHIPAKFRSWFRILRNIRSICPERLPCIFPKFWIIIFTKRHETWPYRLAKRQKSCFRPISRSKNPFYYASPINLDRPVASDHLNWPMPRHDHGRNFAVLFPERALETKDCNQ